MKKFPIEPSAIVVINRNDIFKAQKCKRCVPRMGDIIKRLRNDFESGGQGANSAEERLLSRKYPVLEVFGSEPYEEQVRIFRRAAVVIAPHGAALTSMLHCPRAANIVEFMHLHNVNRQWFMVMAAKLGLS